MAETKYIFVTGGVVSSLGKGIISSSIGKLLHRIVIDINRVASEVAGDVIRQGTHRRALVVQA
ncbi:hypothetical protein [Hoylesella shahii]|uniref:hypothetical protein n=1 Tax=Hoylesella shahii TaxID=228603 RepID=UPI0028E6F6D9|nr:hypothetical protein [Hoylesella shahii]